LAGGSNHPLCVRAGVGPAVFLRPILPRRSIPLCVARPYNEALTDFPKRFPVFLRDECPPGHLLRQGCQFRRDIRT
jgi:hypothetical protein